MFCCVMMPGAELYVVSARAAINLTPISRRKLAGAQWPVGGTNGPPTPEGWLTG
jgi:hypothetical protein